MITFNEFVKTQIEAVQEIAGYLWERGWAERNAGNISVNLTGLLEDWEINYQDGHYIQCELPSETAGMKLFVTGTGERLRDLITKPEKVACILVIDSQAKGYTIVWGGEENQNLRPTSEFVSHIAIHLFNQKQKNGYRCVVHTHPVELIALSHHPEFGKDEALLNQSLWGMLPEIRVFIPKGIAITPYLLPGSKVLADATVERLADRDVILWSKHGALATGKSAIEAFDFLDVANKGALIFLKCLQAGYLPEGLSDEEMKGLEIFL